MQTSQVFAQWVTYVKGLQNSIPEVTYVADRLFFCYFPATLVGLLSVSVSLKLCQDDLWVATFPIITVILCFTSTVDVNEWLYSC